MMLVFQNSYFISVFYKFTTHILCISSIMSCAQVPSVGKKREKRTEDDEDPCERPMKRMCDVHTLDDDHIDELSAVATVQHHREQ